MGDTWTTRWLASTIHLAGTDSWTRRIQWLAGAEHTPGGRRRRLLEPMSQPWKSFSCWTKKAAEHLGTNWSSKESFIPVVKTSSVAHSLRNDALGHTNRLLGDGPPDGWNKIDAACRNVESSPARLRKLALYYCRHKRFYYPNVGGH